VAWNQLDRRDITSLHFAITTVQTLQDNDIAEFEQVLEVDVKEGDRAQQVAQNPSQFSSQYPAETAGNLTEFASSDYGSVPVTRESQHAD
jgi:hypothetical protein